MSCCKCWTYRSCPRKPRFPYGCFWVSVPKSECVSRTLTRSWFPKFMTLSRVSTICEEIGFSTCVNCPISSRRYYLELQSLIWSPGAGFMLCTLFFTWIAIQSRTLRYRLTSWLFQSQARSSQDLGFTTFRNMLGPLRLGKTSCIFCPVNLA